MSYISGFGSEGPFRSLVVGLVAVFLMFPQSLAAQESAMTVSPELRALDGIKFKAGIVRTENVGKVQPLEDELIFSDGKFISMICKSFNFEPAPYWIRSDKDQIHFLAELTSPTDGKMIWEATVRDGKLDGTMHWIKKRWYWTVDVEHKIVGVSDIAEIAKHGSE